LILGSQPKPKSFAGVAASPKYSLSSDTMYVSAACQYPFWVGLRTSSRYSARLVCSPAAGIGR
jgi:hypothetical protein